MDSITILNPVAPRREARVNLAPPVSTLAGELVALVDNTKPGATEFLRGLERGLTERGCRIVYRRKAHPVQLATFLDEIVATCKAVAIALGDCGAGTSWSIQDLISLEQRGVPTVMIAIEQCRAWALNEAKAAGLKAPRLLVIPGEPEFLPPPEVERKGREAAGGVIAALTADGTW